MTNPDDELLAALAPRLPLPRDCQTPIGCIGAGFIMDECHLVAYRNAGLNPVAIASRRTDRASLVAARHGIPRVHGSYRELLVDPAVEVVDVAVPPDVLLEVIREVVHHGDHVRGVLAQKPLGVNYRQALEIVRLCDSAGIMLAVNQNMRYDQSVRACKTLIERGELGESVLGTIEMRAIPHWMPWQQRLGWVTLRIMSIHHLDTLRFWFGDPQRVFASTRPDPRTAAQFAHEDGICLYILEYADGLRERLGRRVDRSGAREPRPISASAGASRARLAARGARSAGPSILATRPAPWTSPRSIADQGGCRRAGTKPGFPTRSPDRWPSCSRLSRKAERAN